MSDQRFTCVAAATLSCLFGVATPVAGIAQEGIFVPSPQHITSTSPAGVNALLGERVRLTVGSQSKKILGRLVGVDSAELVVSVDGTRRTFPISDVTQIEAAPAKKDRTGRWLTVAGLAGMVAAFLFGQVGGY